jgi:phage-related protein
LATTSSDSSIGGPSGCLSRGRSARGCRSFVRTFRAGRTARLLFFAAAGQLVLVGGFIKKTRETPKVELELARARKRAWERAHG